MAYAYYTRPKGGDMMSIEQRWSRSDTIDTAFYRFSGDNGRTWNEPVERRTDQVSHRHQGAVAITVAKYLEPRFGANVQRMKHGPVH